MVHQRYDLWIFKEKNFEFKDPLYVHVHSHDTLLFNRTEECGDSYYRNQGADESTQEFQAEQLFTHGQQALRSVLYFFKAFYSYSLMMIFMTCTTWFHNHIRLMGPMH